MGVNFFIDFDLFKKMVDIFYEKGILFIVSVGFVFYN